jgi:hypothetical protein
MVGQHQRLATPLVLTKTQRLVALAVGALIAVGVIAGLAVALTADSPRPPKGCVSVTVASSLGGAPVQHCGADARAWCASYKRSDLGNAVLADAVRSACRTDHIT